MINFEMQAASILGYISMSLHCESICIHIGQTSVSADVRISVNKPLSSQQQTTGHTQLILAFIVMLHAEAGRFHVQVGNGMNQDGCRQKGTPC